LKVAIIHYWLLGMRGGEKVISALLALYPDADLFTHVYDRHAVSDKIAGQKISTTFIQNLPFAKHFIRIICP
jgi:hypothetical protein